MSKSYCNNTKVVEFIIDSNGVFFECEYILTTETGLYTLTTIDKKCSKHYHSDEINEIPKIINCHDGNGRWSVKVFIIGDNCDDEVFVSDIINKMKTLFNEKINNEISTYQFKIKELERKKLIF